MLNVCDGIVVYPKVINQRVMNELPFMATENIMMAAVKKGGNRQELHEKLRKHSIAAAAVVKQEGKKNDLIERLCQDESFGLSRDEISSILKPENFIGMSVSQVDDFLSDVVNPILENYSDDLKMNIELMV